MKTFEKICIGYTGYIGWRNRLLESIPENRFLRSISGLLKILKILAQKSRALGIHALVSNVLYYLSFGFKLIQHVQSK